MTACIPCFIIPLLLFIFHRYIQPILLKLWNPWEKDTIKEESEQCKFNCDCSWNKKKADPSEENTDDIKTSEAELKES